MDGVGLGAAARDNPFASLALPCLEALIGGPLVAGCARQAARLRVAELDATLGVEGLPQSATGQTTLFTGVNAARRLGRHVPAYPGPRLKAILAAEGLLGRARRAGLEVGFANAFRNGHLAELAASRRRPSVTVYSALQAGLRLRTVDDLVRGEAVSWDLERDLFARSLGRPLPRRSAWEAGEDLVGIAAGHDLTLFETFLTDLAGHGRGGLDVGIVLSRLDRLVGGITGALPSGMTLVLCSDHGNVEEPGHRRHTRNPVPLVVAGSAASCFAGVSSLDQVAPAIVAALAIADRAGAP